MQITAISRSHGFSVIFFFFLIPLFQNYHPVVYMDKSHLMGGFCSRHLCNSPSFQREAAMHAAASAPQKGPVGIVVALATKQTENQNRKHQAVRILFFNYRNESMERAHSTHPSVPQTVEMLSCVLLWLIAKEFRKRDSVGVSPLLAGAGGGHTELAD